MACHGVAVDPSRHRRRRVPRSFAARREVLVAKAVGSCRTLVVEAHRCAPNSVDAFSPRMAGSSARKLTGAIPVQTHRRVGALSRGRLTDLRCSRNASSRSRITPAGTLPQGCFMVRPPPVGDAPFSHSSQPQALSLPPWRITRPGRPLPSHPKRPHHPDWTSGPRRPHMRPQAHASAAGRWPCGARPTARDSPAPVRRRQENPRPPWVGSRSPSHLDATGAPDLRTDPPTSTAPGLDSLLPIAG